MRYENRHLVQGSLIEFCPKTFSIFTKECQRARSVMKCHKTLFSPAVLVQWCAIQSSLLQTRVYLKRVPVFSSRYMSSKRTLTPHLLDTSCVCVFVCTVLLWLRGFYNSADSEMEGLCRMRLQHFLSYSNQLIQILPFQLSSLAFDPLNKLIAQLL